MKPARAPDNATGRGAALLVVLAAAALAGLLACASAAYLRSMTKLFQGEVHAAGAKMEAEAEAVLAASQARGDQIGAGKVDCLSYEGRAGAHAAARKICAYRDLNRNGGGSGADGSRRAGCAGDPGPSR